MKCPDSDVITLYASLQDSAAGERVEVQPGWTHGQLRQHISGCKSCAETLEDWQRAIGRWQGVDLVDVGAFEDSYFDALAEDIERELSGASSRLATEPVQLGVARGTRKQLPGALLALAAIVLVGLAVLWSEGPIPTPDAPLADGSGLAESSDPSDPEAEGRQLGRKLLAALATEVGAEQSDSATPLWSDSALLTASEEDDYGFYFTSDYRDDLDSLDGAEIDSIIQRL